MAPRIYPARNSYPQHVNCIQIEMKAGENFNAGKIVGTLPLGALVIGTVTNTTGTTGGSSVPSLGITQALANELLASAAYAAEAISAVQTPNTITPFVAPLPASTPIWLKDVGVPFTSGAVYFSVFYSVTK